MGNLPRLDPMRQPPSKPHKLESRTVRGVELVEDATVTPASHTHLETEIADGALLARLAADEQITGSWRVAGIDGEFIPQSGSGAPTHSASLGTLYVDLATGDFYVNTDGATTWLKIGPGSAGAHEIDGGSHDAATPLSVAKGGTGAVTLTDHGVLLGSGTGAVTPMGVLATGSLVLGAAGADPTALAISANAGAKLKSTGTTAAWEDDFETINYVIDGGGADITTGVKGYIVVDFACTVVAWTLLGDNAANTMTIDVWNDTYANYPPTVADTMITTGTKPALAAIKGQDTTVDWADVTIAAGSILAFNVDAVGGTKPLRATLSLKVQRT